MGFVSDFLGGSDTEVDVSSLDTLTGEQSKALKDLLAELEGSRGSPQEILGGQLETSSLAGLEGLAEALTMEGGLFGETQSALIEALQGGAQDFEEFFETNVKDPLLETFREDIQPDLSRRFAASGFRSSDRLKQESLATEDLLQSLTRGRSELAFRTEESARDRALRAAGLAGPAGRSQAGTLIDILGAGGGRRRERIQQILEALGVGATENLAAVTPGSPGFIQGIAPGIGEGIGTFLGGKAGKLF